VTGAAARRLVGRIGLSALAAAVVVPIAVVGVTAASAATVESSVPQGGLELLATGPLDSTNQVPGAVVERVLTLRNSGTATYRAIDVSSTTSAPGLRLQVVRCDAGWRFVAARPTCAGNETTVSTGTVGMTATITAAAALAPGGVDSLLVRLTLPAQAGVAAQVTYSAVGR
jgi:hypothetical protein